MANIFISCRDASRRISEQHDTSLSRPARIGLWLHLALCAHCRRYLHQIKLLKSFVSDYPDHLSQMRLPDNARAKIVRQLAQLP